MHVYLISTFARRPKVVGRTYWHLHTGIHNKAVARKHSQQADTKPGNPGRVLVPQWYTADRLRHARILKHQVLHHH